MMRPPHFSLFWGKAFSPAQSRLPNVSSRLKVDFAGGLDGEQPPPTQSVALLPTPPKENVVSCYLLVSNYIIFLGYQQSLLLTLFFLCITAKLTASYISVFGITLSIYCQRYISHFYLNLIEMHVF